jgi:hypothetical protein
VINGNADGIIVGDLVGFGFPLLLAATCRGSCIEISNKYNEIKSFPTGTMLVPSTCVWASSGRNTMTF